MATAASAAPIKVHRSPISAAHPHTASFIFLHGSGGGGEDFHFALSRFCRDLPYLSWICPEAPDQAYSLIGGEKMQVWFDRTSLDLDCPEDPVGIARSVSLVESLVAGEVARGIPRHRIMVGGFSQGGCLAYYCAFGPATVTAAAGADGEELSEKKKAPFAGCITSGSFLPDPSMLFDVSNECTRIPENLKQTPLLMMHGVRDEMIPLSHSESTHERLKAVLSDVTFVPIPNLQHEVDNRVFRKMKEMVEKLLPPV